MAKAPLGLHWFRHDLRVQDNAALQKLAEQCSSVIGIYVFDPAWHVKNEWDAVSLGAHRQRFIEDALVDLRASLQHMGSELIMLNAEPVNAIVELVALLDITHLSFEMHAGFNELKQIEQITTHFDARIDTKTEPDISLIEGDSNYLYSHEDLPFLLENMPDTFSPFRRKVEKYAQASLPLSSELRFDQPIDPLAIRSIQASFGKRLYDLSTSTQSTHKLDTQHCYPAGESGAMARIEEYFFATDGIATYKETRNGLDGWDFSSRLSAYLAHGCISPRTVLARIKQYESERVANDSTYWLFFELLWREFFHFQHMKHGAKFFAYDGIQHKTPSTVFDSKAFALWCSGQTGYGIVDACMRQLNQTGFMSNRGRQLVASCFVHELNLDWRYGAAYFEQQLIDFDVASNWGNWQYLAGVGSDPRGHRQFNLAKQSEIYDPNGRFIAKWVSA